MQAIIRYRKSSGSTPTRRTNATRCTPSTPTRSTTGTAPPIKRSRPKQPGSRFQAPRTRRESQEPSAVLQRAHPGRPGRRHPLHLDGVRHGRSSVRVWLPLEGRHAPWACGLGTARLRLDSPPVTFDGTVTLHPSIGNGQLPCRSHYFIRHDRIDWLRPISAAATRAAGIRDRAVHIDRKPQPSTQGTSRGGCAFWSGEGSPNDTHLQAACSSVGARCDSRCLPPAPSSKLDNLVVVMASFFPAPHAPVYRGGEPACGGSVS